MVSIALEPKINRHLNLGRRLVKLGGGSRRKCIASRPKAISGTCDSVEEAVKRTEAGQRFRYFNMMGRQPNDLDIEVAKQSE